MSCEIRAELERMYIEYNDLQLIRSKSDVHVFRIYTDHSSYVLKLFNKLSDRREIDNYRILYQLGIPTLKLIAATDASILLEDIAQSQYRLGTADDLADPDIARLIALWYRQLHDRGQDYADLPNLYNENDHLTRNNLSHLKVQTQTQTNKLWPLLDQHYDTLISAIQSLPHTLTYNDFYYTNLAVARDRTSAIMFDYNLLGQSYAYADIRNVCSSLTTVGAKEAFTTSYGQIPWTSSLIDSITSPLITLIMAYQRHDTLPAWAVSSLEDLKNGSVERSLIHLLTCL